MDLTRRRLLEATVGAVALGFAGCVEEQSTEIGGGSTPTETATGAPTTGTEDGTPATDQQMDDESDPTVGTHSHPEYGEILVGPTGMTLYVFDQDTQGDGSSACYDDCASAWPPLTVDGEPTKADGVGAELTTFERETGERQVAANGWPLYYFASDESPGDANGQGVSEVWWVLDADGAPIKPDQTGGGAAY